MEKRNIVLKIRVTYKGRKRKEVFKVKRHIENFDFEYFFSFKLIHISYKSKISESNDLFSLRIQNNPESKFKL